jgi:hypothetical protein
MRLEQYITEKRSPVDIPGYDMEKNASIIKTDCQPFFKENTSGRFLYRGTNKSIGEIEKIIPRKERKPSDMPRFLHNELNIVFAKKFGWPVRNGVFATSDDREAEEYGDLYLFFPIGNYKYVWSPKIPDLWKLFDKNTGIFKDLMHMTSIKPSEEKYLEKSVDTYIDKDLSKAMKTNKSHEISFLCEAYYMIDPLYEEYLL